MCPGAKTKSYQCLYKINAIDLFNIDIYKKLLSLKIELSVKLFLKLYIVYYYNYENVSNFYNSLLENQTFI